VLDTTSAAVVITGFVVVELYVVLAAVLRVDPGIVAQHLATQNVGTLIHRTTRVAVPVLKVILKHRAATASTLATVAIVHARNRVAVDVVAHALPRAIAAAAVVGAFPIAAIKAITGTPRVSGF